MRWRRSGRGRLTLVRRPRRWKRGREREVPDR
jgi:hypothetical protein